MIDPLLDSTLHLHLHQPIHIVACSLVVGRLGHQFVNLFLCVAFLSVVSVHAHPLQELVVIDDVFFKSITRLVHKVHMHFGIVGVHLATTLIDWHEDWFDTAGCLGHQAGCSRRSNGQTGNVAAAILLHLFIQRRVGLLNTVHEGVILFALTIIHGKCSALLGHVHR